MAKAPGLVNLGLLFCLKNYWLLPDRLVEFYFLVCPTIWDAAG